MKGKSRVCSQSSKWLKTRVFKGFGLYRGIGSSKKIALIASYEADFLELQQKRGAQRSM
ncbi:hypothetical protein [Methylobacillus sp. Pita1]|uniref:hypothetical protein n=1 Tax=Methylobacillus sp. Pita1 TaxID=3382642 RepID=UPI0038B4D7D0